MTRRNTYPPPQLLRLLRDTMAWTGMRSVAVILLAIGLSSVVVAPSVAATTCNGWFCANIQGGSTDAVGGHSRDTLGGPLALYGELLFDGVRVDWCTDDIYGTSGCSTYAQTDICVVATARTSGFVNPLDSTTGVIEATPLFPVQESALAGPCNI